MAWLNPTEGAELKSVFESKYDAKCLLSLWREICEDLLYYKGSFQMEGEKKLMKTQHLLLYLFSENFGKTQPYKNAFMRVQVFSTHIFSKWHSTL